MTKYIMTIMDDADNYVGTIIIQAPKLGGDYYMSLMKEQLEHLQEDINNEE